MSKTVIINRPLSDLEIREITKLAEDGANVYTMPGSKLPEFAKRLILNTEEKKEINYKTMADVLQFGDLTIGDQTVADLFRIDTASIWHYHKFRVYFAVRNLMYFLSPIGKNFSSFQDHVWFVPDEAKVLQKLFPEVVFRFHVKKSKSKFNFDDLFSYVVLVKYRFFRYLFSIKGKPEYLVYLTEKYSTVMEKNSLKPHAGHHILEYLISDLDNRFCLLTEVLIPKPRGKSDYSFSSKQFQSSWGTCSKIFLEGIIISGLLKGSIRKSAKEAQLAIGSAYPKVRGLELSLVHQLTLEVFQSFDRSSRFFLYRYFAARNYFSHSEIKAVIAADENSPLTKSILDAAKFCGIKIIGLQHGTMHDLHPAYLYTRNDCKNHVMPDLTLTWGKYWEEFLIEKGNYPKDSVISVGQIRTDIIPELVNAEKQKKARSTEKIVFASQPQRDPELRYQAAYDVFKAAKRFSKSKLIIKLHPRESEDSQYYAEIAKETGCTNYVFDTTSDLYQLIASCDILITCFSTVGTETVYFYKPLIILDHLKQDIQGYAAEGVAFQAIDSESLGNILSGIFRGTLKVDHDKYDAFIRKYAYRIDGKVAERCIEVITSVK
jgi:CDP-glycerol glycerophosphotransferase (TagB/SpsB family)